MAVAGPYGWNFRYPERAFEAYRLGAISRSQSQKALGEFGLPDYFGTAWGKAGQTGTAPEWLKTGMPGRIFQRYTDPNTPDYVMPGGVTPPGGGGGGGLTPPPVHPPVVGPPDSGQFPFQTFLQENPEATYASQSWRFGNSPRQQQYFENAFSPVYTKYKGRLANMAQGGQVPDLKFGDYLQDQFRYNDYWGGLAPQMRGERPGQFAPPLRWS